MEANPELVAYLRKHWNHGPETLRKKLIAEGVDEAEVEAAIRDARPKAKSSSLKRLPISIAATLVTTGLSIWLFKNGSQTAPPKPGSKQVLIQENPNDPHQAYVGHYGYILRIPLGYNVLSDFEDPEKTTEVVYFFPKGTDLTNLHDEGIYKPLGILRLEVRPRPRSIPEGRLGISALERQVQAAFQAEKLAFTVHEIMVGGLPSIVVECKDPWSRAEAFVVGSKVVYKLIGGDNNELFSDTLQSLHEVGEKPEEP